MKKRCVIPLLLVCSVGLLWLHISLIGALVPILVPAISKQCSFNHVVIIRSIGVAVSFLSAFAVAFPFGYFARRNGLIFGLLLPSLGGIVVFGPHASDSLQLLKTTYLEFLTLVIFCGVFGYLGQMLRGRLLRGERTGGGESGGEWANP